MSLVTRGLGSGLLVTRGLGTPHTVPYLTGDIFLRVDRAQSGRLCVELVRAAALQVDRQDALTLCADRRSEATLRVDREQDDDLKL